MNDRVFNESNHEFAMEMLEVRLELSLFSWVRNAIDCASGWIKDFKKLHRAGKDLLDVFKRVIKIL